MSHLYIKNARIVNEGKEWVGDVHVHHDRIEQVGSCITPPSRLSFQEIDASGLVLMPGVIDAHVHFREPGLTHKGNIASESRAAVAGGVTSFMDMPNTIPNVLTAEQLETKYGLAAASSFCNYSFFMGLCKDNLEEALTISTEDVCGLTDDGLYFDRENSLLCNSPEYLERLFSRSEHLIALHSEDESIISAAYQNARQAYGDNIPPHYHSLIRNEEACLSSTRSVLSQAKKHGCRLHLLHVSTGAEALLLDSSLPTDQKRITGEACVHHLFFSTEDYASKGNAIKWNPSVKSPESRRVLQEALLSGHIDMVATDHAPHTLAEKQGSYEQVKPGGPMIQHALPVLLELYHDGLLSLPQVVEKTSHSVAEVYRIKERGYIREGYFADLVLVHLNDPWMVSNENLLYACGWSPLTGHRFRSKIKTVFVNGFVTFNEGVFTRLSGRRLRFSAAR